MPEPVDRTCFVVGPVGAEGSATRIHADWVFDNLISRALMRFPAFASPIRADRISLPGMVTSQMVRLLMTADLVVADLSFQNPNAFYELGIRHMAQLPTVHMQLRHEPRPFDLGGVRTIEFSSQEPNEAEIVTDRLAAAIAATLHPDSRVENPTTDSGIVRLNSGYTTRLALPVSRIFVKRTREQLRTEKRGNEVVGILATAIPRGGSYAFCEMDDGYIIDFFGERPERKVLALIQHELGRAFGHDDLECVM